MALLVGVEDRWVGISQVAEALLMGNPADIVRLVPAAFSSTRASNGRATATAALF